MFGSLPRAHCLCRARPWLSVGLHTRTVLRAALRGGSPLAHSARQQTPPPSRRPSRSTGRLLAQGPPRRTRPRSSHVHGRVQAQQLPIRVRASSAKRVCSKSRPPFCIPRPPSHFRRIRSLPSQIAFEIALFPNNLPLPTQKVSARIIGGTIHFLHFWILASHDNDDGWDNVSGVRNTAWFDWVSFLFLLTFLSHLP